MTLQGTFVISSEKAAAILDSTGGSLKFTTARGQNGEEIYRQTVRQSLSESYMIRKIKFCSGPKYLGKSVRIYTCCFHGTSFVLWIKKEDFISGKDLKLQFELDCSKCGMYNYVLVVVPTSFTFLCHFEPFAIFD